MNNPLNGTLKDMQQFHAKYYRIFLQFFIGLSIGLFFSCLAMVANFIVLVIIFKKKHQRTPFDFVIASLSIAYFSASICNFIFIAYKVGVIFLSPSEFEMHYRFQSNIVLDISSMFFHLSLMHVLLVTFLRFFASFWPMKYAVCMHWLQQKFAFYQTIVSLPGTNNIAYCWNHLALQSHFLAVCCHMHVLQQISKFFSMFMAIWQSHLYQSISLPIPCCTSTLAIG